VWGLSGLVTAALLGVPLAHLITGVEDPQNAYARPQHVVTRTETVPQPVTSLVVRSYGGPVQVASGPVSGVQVTETIMYDSGNTLPAVMQSVSGGRLGGPELLGIATDPAARPRLMVSSGGGPLRIEPAPR
jgi:hypothetical protein